MEVPSLGIGKVNLVFKVAERSIPPSFVVVPVPSGWWCLWVVEPAIDNPIFHRHLHAYIACDWCSIACQTATNTSVYSWFLSPTGSKHFHFLVVWHHFFVRPIFLFWMITPIDEHIFHMHWNHESVSAQISSRYSHIVSPLHPLYFPQ